MWVLLGGAWWYKFRVLFQRSDTFHLRIGMWTPWSSHQLKVVWCRRSFRRFFWQALSHGFASFDYQPAGFQEAQLEKLVVFCRWWNPTIFWNKNWTPAWGKWWTQFDLSGIYYCVSNGLVDLTSRVSIASMKGQTSWYDVHTLMPGEAEPCFPCHVDTGLINPLPTPTPEGPEDFQ